MCFKARALTKVSPFCGYLPYRQTKEGSISQGWGNKVNLPTGRGGMVTFHDLAQATQVRIADISKIHFEVVLRFANLKIMNADFPANCDDANSISRT